MTAATTFARARMGGLRGPKGDVGPGGTLANNSGFTASGPSIVKATDVAALKVQNAAGNDVLTVDTEDGITNYAGVMTKGRGRLAIGELPGAGDDCAFTAKRDLVGDCHSHAFRDESRVNCTVAGNAYASFDAVPEFVGTGTPADMDHARFYQSRPQWHRNGNLTLLNGYGSDPTVTTGNITQVVDYLASAGSITAGHVGTRFAFYADPLINATTNVGLFIQNASYILGDLTLAGAVSGITTIAASGQCAFGAGNFTGNLASYSSAGGVFVAKAVGGAAYGGIQAYTNGTGSNNGFSINGAGGAVLINCLVPAVGGLEVNATIAPHTDNTFNIGTASFRWGTIYAGTGTINTSDAALKQDVAAIRDDLLDAWAAVQWVQYRWKDAVLEKGEDGARLHFGAIAQQVRDAIDGKLGAGAGIRLGLLCYDQWEQQTRPILKAVTKTRQVDGMVMVDYMAKASRFKLDAKGRRMTKRVRIRNRVRPGKYDITYGQQPIVEIVDVPRTRPELGKVDETYEAMEPTGETEVAVEAGERWGLRYDECFVIEAAYQRRQMDRIEAKLAALGA